MTYERPSGSRSKLCGRPSATLMVNAHGPLCFLSVACSCFIVWLRLLVFGTCLGGDSPLGRSLYL